VSHTEVTITRLSRADLEQRLREFERSYTVTTGEQLSSADFFERFRAGEFDSLFGMRWAGHWRAYTRVRP